MLDAPKKPILFVQFNDFIGRKKVQLMKRSQRFQHARFLQEGMVRAVNKLKRLHYKFDLANTTGAQLDVTARFSCPTISRSMRRLMPAISSSRSGVGLLG